MKGDPKTCPPRLRVRLMALALVLAVVVPAAPLPAVAAPVDHSVLRGAASVHDGDTLTIGTERIRIFGIDAPELSQHCRDAKGRDWACGSWSRGRLLALVAGGVICRGHYRDKYGRLVASCEGSGGDLGAQMVVKGAAFAARAYSLDYVDAEKRAAVAGIGIWQGQAENPAAYRAAERDARNEAAPQQGPEGCRIKGNISRSGKIYHLPGDASWADTRIDSDRGERWFCSEKEARAAGWRPARN